MDTLSAQVRNNVNKKGRVLEQVPIEHLEVDPNNRQLIQSHLKEIIHNMETYGQQTLTHPLIGTVKTEDEYRQAVFDNLQFPKIKIIVSLPVSA